MAFVEGGVQVYVPFGKHPFPRELIYWFVIRHHCFF